VPSTLGESKLTHTGMGCSRIERIIYHLLDIRYRRRILSSILSIPPNNLPRCTKHFNPSSLPPPLPSFGMRADISGMIYEKYPLDHGRLLRHSQIDDSINSLIRRNKIPQTRAAMTTDLPKRSPYLKLSRKIKSNSLITGTFIVYVWGIFHIIQSSSCSLVFLSENLN
jgi:hypothetical protein